MVSIRGDWCHHRPPGYIRGLSARVTGDRGHRRGHRPGLPILLAGQAVLSVAVFKPRSHRSHSGSQWAAQHTGAFLPGQAHYTAHCLGNIPLISDLQPITRPNQIPGLGMGTRLLTLGGCNEGKVNK